MEDSKDRVNDEKSSSLEGNHREEEALNVNGSAETCAEANVSECKELTDEDILGEDYVMDGVDRDSVVQLVIDHLLDEIELQQDDQSEEEMKTRMLKMTQRTWHFEQAKVARIPRDVFDHFAVFEEDSNTVRLNVTQLKVFIDKYLWNASNYVEAVGWRTKDMKIHSNLSVPEQAPENRDILVKSYETKNADQENKQILELAEVRDKRRADDATRFNERLQQHLSGGGTVQSLMRIITTEKHATDHEQKFAKSRGFFKPPRAENNNSRPRRPDHGHRDGDQSAAHKRPFASGRGGRGGDNRGFRGGGRHRETAGPPQKRPRNDSGGDRRMSKGRDRGGSERRGRGGGGDGRDRRNNARGDRNDRNGPRGGGFGGGRSDRGGGGGRGGYRGSNSRDGGGRGMRGGRGRGGGGVNASGQRPNRGPPSSGGFGNRADFAAPSAADYSGYGEPQYGGSEGYGTSSAYDHSNYYHMGYDGSAYVDPSYGQYYQ